MSGQQSAEHDAIEVVRVRCPHRIGLCYRDATGLSLLPCDCNEPSEVLEVVAGVPSAPCGQYGERPYMILVRDLGTGRLEREFLGSTPFAKVPESPYYRSSPGSFLSARAWVDEDGRHAIIAHDCRETREVHALSWPTWQIADGIIIPSYSCAGCGLHSFVKINAVEVSP